MAVKLLNYKLGNQMRFGIDTGDGVIDVKRSCEQLDLAAPLTMEEALEQGMAGVERLGLLLGRDLPRVPREELEVGPLFRRPSKILCIGLNYRDHALESGMEIPKDPVVFSKFENALACHGQAIPIPPAVTQCDYEAELVAVVGRKASCVSPEEGLGCVYGYTAGNDLSARNLQFLSSQWLLGKSCDGFAPIGPSLATADGVDPGDLEISCRVNGELRQQSNTRHMIFSVGELVSRISHCMTLLPGDLIFTGTPGGVALGMPEGQQKWLKPGDVVEVSIGGLDTLRNTIG